MQWTTFSKLFSDHNESILYVFVSFLGKQGDIFDLICNDLDHQELLYQLVWEIFPKFKIKWLPVGIPAPDLQSERVGMAVRMMVEVISRWGKETHCDVKQAKYYVDRMLRIIEATEQNKLP